MRELHVVWKRMTGIFLALVMVISLLPSTAFAQESTEGESTKAPASITVTCEDSRYVDGKLVGAAGDTFSLQARDENGDSTPVTWSTTTSSSIISLDSETGIFTVKKASVGSTTYLYFIATSTLDSSVKSKSTCIYLTGYQFSSETYSVALSTDGQTAKTISVSGGYSGHSIWSYEEDKAKGIATLANDPGSGTSIKFNALRPGAFSLSVALDFDQTMTDTATISITGVAVEDEEGSQGKTYLKMGAKNPAPTVQLSAYCEAGKSISAWSSSAEEIATVDENGLVTAHGIGTALITATDSAGTKGGIKVVVSSLDTPYFESLEFLTSSFTTGTWVAGSTFSPTTLEYSLPIKSYSTAKLTLQATTLYDTDSYSAAAYYTGIDGTSQEVSIESGKITYLENIPFDAFDVTITIWEKENPDQKTNYLFHVTRPRDTTKTIKATTGIVITPAERSLLTVKYNGFAEGVMAKAGTDGQLSSGSGVSATQYNYRTYLLENASAFTLTFTGNTTYTHLRYSTDEGMTWTELPQGGGITETFTFLAAETVKKVQVQVLDDQTYEANLQSGKEGFSEGTKTTYTVWVEQVGNVMKTAEILEAKTQNGDWYPTLREGIFTYDVVVANGTTSLPMTYTISEGATVKLGSTLQTADEDGVYTLNLKSSAQTLTVTSADGKTVSTYSFKLLVKSQYDTPDKVTDYLCINSQYTNVSYGIQPETTLAGTLKSLGNFGGYITYYYEDAIINDPKNLYGVDFYVYGNANEDTSTATGCSFFEPGQVWVSEDGENWYALAGSDHYEDDVIWDYQITYEKNSSGKTGWTDNQGNSSDGLTKSGTWPTESIYFLNGLVGKTTITLQGILLPSNDGTITGNGTSDARHVSWGYADCFANGTIGAAVNPYLDNSNHKLKANGFDLSWAVDAEGNPVSLTNGVHYIKVVTASNIWHSAFGEKSTEVSYVVRAAAQESAVGVTGAADSIVIADAKGVKESKAVTIKENQQVYTVDVGDIESLNLTVLGADKDANIYINNQRVQAGEAASGFQIDKETGEKLVRVLIQEGEKEPVIYLLKLTGSSSSENDSSENGEGDSQNPSDKTPSEPENADGKEISVTFTLYGDEKHGEDGQVHTLSQKNLQAWISGKNYTVSEGSSVRDVFEKALTEAGLTWNNEGGTYVTGVDGLAAFDNGANSGWMYTLNGKYPSLDFSAQKVSDGDVIVFHYTDDWSKESYEDSSDSEKEETPAISAKVETIYKTTGDYLEKLAKQNIPTVGSVGGDWLVLGLARSGRNVPEGYYENVVSYIKQVINENEQLSRTKSTENSRVILALTAAGYDVTNVGGHNLLKGLTDMSYIKKQGINGVIFALLAFDSKNYEIPSGDVSREGLIEAILDAQLADGGWTLSGENADADVTAMALQALAPYVEAQAESGDQSVSAAVEKGLACLSGLQTETGGFGSSESCAQVLVALTALSIDPDTDSRFLKNGYSVVDALSAYYVENGGFSHDGGDDLNLMATEQGYYALASYARYKAGQTSLYNMSDVTVRTENALLTSGQEKKEGAATGDEGEITLYLAAMLLAFLGMLILIRLRKKSL